VIGLLFWGSKVKVTGSVSSFCILERNLHTRIAIHRHSLGSITSRLWFCGCLVRASLTFARWRNQSSAWVQNQDRVPSSFYLFLTSVCRL